VIYSTIKIYFGDKMFKKTIDIIVSLIMLMYGTYQTNEYTILYPVFLDGSFDYIDETGNIIIDGNFDFASFFSDGLAVAKQNDDYGIIDINGDWIVEPAYDEIGDFHCGRAYIVNEENLGYINTNGVIIVEMKYDSDKKNEAYNGITNRDYSENHVIVESDNNKIVLDINGNVICSSLRYPLAMDAYVGNMHNGLIRVFGEYYDKNGNLAISDKGYWDYVRFGYYPWDFSNGLAKYPTYVNPTNNSLWPNEFYAYDDYKYWKIMYVDETGKYAFDKQFDSGSSFSENLAVVEIDGENAVINTKGETVFKTQYKLYEYYSGGLITFEDSKLKKSGFLDTKGNIIIPPIYDDVYMGFVDDLALVKTGDNLAYINKSGEIVITFDYSEDLVRKAEEINYESIFQN
jgi:hypothetical protein